MEKQTSQNPIPQQTDLPPIIENPQAMVSNVPSEKDNLTVSPLTPIAPETPKSKNKLMPILLFVLILAILGVGGLYAYKNFFIKAPEPTPTPEATSEPTTNPTANWEVYSNSTHNVSFKYPSSWILTETKGQVENGETYNTIVKLTKNDASINLHFNMDGLGGMPQTYEGKSFTLDGHNLYQFNKTNSYNKTKEVGLSNSLTTLGVFEINDVAYLINITYPETMIETEEISLLDEFDQILSTFKFTKIISTPIPSDGSSTSYNAPSTWSKATILGGLKLCLPPKWENESGFGTLFYNRDSAYRPQITILENIPYTSGSYADAYYTYWQKEYPDVSSLLTTTETNVSGNKVITFTPKGEAKSSPEGLTVVWFASGKLWKAGLSSWNMINSSQSLFLKDFYTMISCSF